MEQLWGWYTSPSWVSCFTWYSEGVSGRVDWTPFSLHCTKHNSPLTPCTNSIRDHQRPATCRPATISSHCRHAAVRPVCHIVSQSHHKRHSISLSLSESTTGNPLPGGKTPPNDVIWAWRHDESILRQKQNDELTARRGDGHTRTHIHTDTAAEARLTINWQR